MTNATGLRFDAHPWEFALNATEAQRAAQSAHRRMLAEGGAFSAGEGGYVSPMAHVLGRRIALGEDNLVAANVRLDGDLVTGRNCSFNLNSTAAGQVRLGDDVRLAAGAGLWGFDHAHSDPDRPISSQGIVSKGITVGDDVWIGTNAVITDGVTIGSHVVIAAGAIVTRDVPDYAVAAGNPARVIRDRRAPRPGRNEASDTLLRLSDMAENDWRNILEGYRSEDRPGYIYSDPRNNSDDPIRPDCDAIQIAAMFDDIPAGASSVEWIDRLQGRQDSASGLFMRRPEEGAPEISGRDPTNCHSYDILCVGYALECLGAAPKSRVTWADGVLSDLPAWLNALPWREHGWHCGAMIDTLGTAVYLNHRYFGGQPELPNLVGELILRASPDSGMWSPPASDDWLEPVNGFYRLTRGAFAQFGLPVPYAQQVIDTVIAHAEKYRYFRNDTWTACNVLDVVHPLLLCAMQTEYRSDDIDRVFAQFATEILRTWQDGAGFAFKPGEPAGLQGTEMWLSVAALIALRLGVSDRMSFRLKGIHRFEPGLVSHRMQ